MRFTLDSASEVSADEAPAATTSTITPKRRGILRNPSSSHSVTAQTPVQNFTPSVSAQQDKDEDDSTTPQRRSRKSTMQTSPFQRRRERSVTPAFESVGVPSPSAAPRTRSQPLPSADEIARTPPPWMRQSYKPRLTAIDREFESSDDDDQEDDSSSSGSSSFDLGTTTATSSAENLEDNSTDSEREPRAGDTSAKSVRAAKTGHRRTRTRIQITTNDEEWEEWNRAATQLAWDRARRSQSALTTAKEGARDSNASWARSTLPSRARQSKPSVKKLDADMDEVRALLSSLDVRRTEEDNQTRAAFEARNKALWQGIDASILAAEREAKQAAAAEARRLETVRKAQMEAEQKAKAQRQQELDRIKQEEKRAAEEAEKQKQDAEKQKQAAAEEEKRKQAALEQDQKTKAMGGSGADVRRSAEDEYKQWINRIERIKRDVLPHISGNPELRKQCFTAKRQITPKVGQLTNSRQEIVRITQAIGSVLSAAKQASGASGEIYTWILNHLSKCLIRQAEQEVAAKQDTAYPLARVVVWLLLEGHSELGDVLMARLVKKCPWVLAVWPPRPKDTDDATYRKMSGYKTADESTENYSNRMCGIFAFYIAILQTTPTTPPSNQALNVSLVPEHLRHRAMWIWCVRSLTPPAPFLGHPLAPSLWSTFLEVGGNKVLGLYGRQMQKVLRLMLDQGLGQKKADFVKRESEPNVKAAMVRLELLLKAWAQNGRITEATKGTEMEA